MAAPFRALPPGVYFNPTAEECVRDYLKPWAAGVPPPTDRVICDVDVYSDSPGALLLGREPGFSRGFDHKWLLLSRGRTAAGGGGRGSRAVATGGSWQSEQTPRGVADGDGEDESQPRGGRRRSFGFYVGKNGRKRGEKTPWLMEEFTALEDGGGDGTFPVFCRIYLSPRLEKEDKEKKRQILGDAMVAFDRTGKLKPVRVVVPPEIFDAAARALGTAPPPPPRVLGFQQDQPARRVLGHQQGQPPPAARRVLGHQQGQPPPPPARRALGYHQQAQQPAYPPPPPFLGHQHGQAAATPAVLGDRHGRAMLPPRAVPAHRDGDAMLPWGVPARHRAGHAAAAHHQGSLGSRQGQAAVQPHLPRVLGPCYNQEASPEKKPRLAYGSPAPQRRSPGSGPSSCVVHVSPSQEQGVVIEFDDDNQCSAGPVAPALPPQEIPGTAATAGSAEEEPPCDVSAPAPAELAGDAGNAGAEPPISDFSIYVNLVDIEPFSGYVPDFQVPGEFQPPVGFDEFPLVDLLGF